MMSKERRNLLITTFICVCSLLVYISFTVIYPEPQTVQQNSHSGILLFVGIIINIKSAFFNKDKWYEIVALDKSNSEAISPADISPFFFQHHQYIPANRVA